MDTEEKQNNTADISDNDSVSEKMTKDEVKRQLDARAAEFVMFLVD